MPLRFPSRPLSAGLNAWLLVLLAGCQATLPPPTKPMPDAPAPVGPAPAAAAPMVAVPPAAPSTAPKPAAAAPVARRPAAPAAPRTPPAAGSGTHPRLLVLLVVDGLPERQILAYRDELAEDGLARFLDRGAWFSEAYYGQAVTVAATGHATLLTGAYAHRTGIIANEWRDPVTGDPEYCTGDPAYQYIGQVTRPLDGTSPRNLRVPTVGDVLREADARAKVIGISGKDRGAILLAGKSGTAYMYMPASGAFASSSYYMRRHPAWVEAFNAAKPAERWFKTSWAPLLPDAAYARSLPDRLPWYGQRGAALPMLMGAPDGKVPGRAYFSQLLRSPFADQLTLDFARAAIAGEELGRDDVPDILAISLSAHDYINHRFSAESRFSQDHLLRLDRMLQDFFRDLDRSVGRDNYIALLTADHGFMPAPEFTAEQGLRSGRILGGQLLTRINAGLEEVFGDGRWASLSGSSLLLSRELMALHRVDPDEVAEEARALLLDEPGIAAAYTRSELATGSRFDAPFFSAMQRAWHPEVSGDVQFILKPYWMFASSSAITSHGSPYPYDTHVPLMAWGPRWIKAGRVDDRVEEVDIAPSIAAWLGVEAPPASEGRPLPLPH